MGECLNPELPVEEQIEYLLQHAEKELSLSIKLQAPRVFDSARHSVKRAHVLNDFCTGMLSAFQRLTSKWHDEDRGKEFDCTEHAGYLAFLTSALLPPLYKVEGRH